MQYHYADQANQVIGPVNEEELHALYGSGHIAAETNVFPEGGSGWQAYNTLVSLPPPAPSLAPVVYMPPVTETRLAQAPTAASTKTCPFCAEEVALEAKKCKHCGEILDVALRAAEEAKQRSQPSPMVFMNAGGAASSSAAVSQPQVIMVGSRKSGLLAALLNLFVPGLGYMYCGRVLLGCVIFLFTVVAAAGTAGIALLILTPVYFIDGFLAAGRANRHLVMRTI